MMGQTFEYPNLVAGTDAWAPADGEELAGGGGALMSANLLDGATVTRGTKDSDGYWVLSQNDGTDKKDSPMWRIDGQPTLTENQTIHMACSVMPDEDLSTNAINIGVRYKDAAGNSNWTGAYSGKNSKAGVWTRLEMECVVPSGMRVDWCVLANAYSHAAGAKVTGVTISYGSPVCLASSAHTPYATQDHVMVTYATKAQLKVTDDSVKAEVSARAQTDRNVADLSSRLTQTANSLTSEISDRRSAIATVTGLANAAQSTANTAKSTVDGMKLGGRNLLKGTSMDSKAVTTPTTASTIWGSGFAFPADASLRAVIPYGAEYRCSVDVLLPVDGRIVVDMNTFAEGGTSWADNDNDNSNRRTDNVFNVRANVWTRISWGSENTNDANAGKQAIYVNDSVGLLPQSAAVTWHYRGLKVELGNKATDWTPAPEDTDSAVAAARKAGTDAQSSANAAKTMATENQSIIKQLSNSITSEVTQRTKTDQMVSDLSSRLTQTADGFSASIDRLSDTDKKVNSWFGFGADSSGNPQLTMGSSTSPVVGVYTNAGLAYKARSGATLLELDGASRSSTMPHVHADDVSIGSWQWVPTQNGTHFTLQWIGG